MLFGTLALTSCGGKGDSATGKSDSAKTEGSEAKLAEIARIDGWKTFEGPGFELQYPEAWGLDAEAEGNILVKLMNPRIDEGDEPGLASINVVKEDLRGNTLSLDEYLKMSLDNLKKQMDGVNIDTQKDKTVNGLPCKEVVYSFEMEGMKMKLMQRIYVRSGSGWVITYGGVMLDEENNFYDKFLADGSKILDTFGVK